MKNKDFSWVIKFGPVFWSRHIQLPHLPVPRFIETTTEYRNDRSYNEESGGGWGGGVERG